MKTAMNRAAIVRSCRAEALQVGNGAGSASVTRRRADHLSRSDRRTSMVRRRAVASGWART